MHRTQTKPGNRCHCTLQQDNSNGKAFKSEVKQALYVHASDASEGGATLRTRVYDDLGKVPWPQDVDGRALRNRFAATFPNGVPEAVRPAAPRECAACMLECAARWASSPCGACVVAVYVRKLHVRHVQRVDMLSCMRCSNRIRSLFDAHGQHRIAMRVGPKCRIF